MDITIPPAHARMTYPAMNHSYDPERKFLWRCFENTGVGLYRLRKQENHYPGIFNKKNLHEVKDFAQKQ